MTWQFVLISVMTDEKMIFFTESCPSCSNVSCTEDTSENNDVDSESEENIDLPPKFQNLPEAIACLESVHQFLELKGFICEATKTDKFTYYATFCESLKSCLTVGIFCRSFMKLYHILHVYFTMTMNIIKYCVKSFIY